MANTKKNYVTVPWPPFILFPDSIITDIDLFLHNLVVSMNNIKEESTPEGTHNWIVVLGTKDHKLLEEVGDLNTKINLELDEKNNHRTTPYPEWHYYMGSLIENYVENGIIPEEFPIEYKTTFKNTTVVLLTEEDAKEENGIHVCQQFLLKNINLDPENAVDIDIFKMNRDIRKIFNMYEYLCPSRIVVELSENSVDLIKWEIKGNLWVVKSI